MSSACEPDSTSSSSSQPRGRLTRRWAARGFSPADLLNFVRPTGAWQHHENIAYGAGPRHRLDVYQPAAVGPPVVVFFYGGSWQSGSRDLYRFLGGSLAARGIMAVVPDYTVYPQARYPVFLQDAAQAVRFVRDQATEWGGRADRLVLMGHSAGAYIAAMLALDGRWLHSVDLDTRRDVSGMIGLAGPYDFLPISDPTLQTIFGGPARIDTQPICYVTGDAVPALLIAPRRDSFVSPGNTSRLAARIRAQGGRVLELQYPHVGHLSLIGAFAPGLRFLAPVLAEVTAFVMTTTGGGES
jgi:acetyl esterase/lipase